MKRWNTSAHQQSQLDARREEAAQLGKQISQVERATGSAKEHRSGLLSRQKLLKDLEAKREGVSEGVKSVLRQREQKFPFVRGLVADVLRVDVEHAHVIEAALDGRDQWLVTEDSAAALPQDMLEDLEGRVNFADLAMIHADQIRGDSTGHSADSPGHCRYATPRHGRSADAADRDSNWIRLEPASPAHSAGGRSGSC